MIHPTDTGLFVVSSRGIWLPGVYADARTARYAFRFSYETLRQLQKIGGVITFRMLQEVHQALRQQSLS